MISCLWDLMNLKYKGELKMFNWFVNKEETKRKLINGIMGELEILLDYDNQKVESASYWVDNGHNVFCNGY